MMRRFVNVLVIVVLAGACFYLYEQHSQIQEDLTRLTGLQEQFQDTVKGAIGVSRPQPVQRSISEKSGHTWLDVQKQVKDTVVQVYSQATDFNWFEPYKTPDQGEGAGSGFFINEKGDMITNYHVVAQSCAVQIQIPSFGMERFDMEIVGVSPERDIALLKPTQEAYEKISQKLGTIPFLKLGDSDSVLRSQEVLALGFPLGQSRLKSTLGIVSGRERLGSFGYIQTTAPINPGNSGGPALATDGTVVGINNANIPSAQNIGYIIPINEVKNALKDLYKVKLLRKPVLGCIFTLSTPEMVKLLGNPEPGGWYVAKVFKHTLFERVGVKDGDMLYQIGGYDIDMYGELNVPWSEDKVSLFEFLNRYTVGDMLHCVMYRKGQRKDFTFKLEQIYLPPIRMIYPEFEPEATDYEIIGGMVVMELTMNHVGALVSRSPRLASSLMKFDRPEHQHDSALIITHVLPNSQAHIAKVIRTGEIIDEINDIKVKSLADFRKAVPKSKQTGFLTVKTDDNLYAVMALDKILRNEDMLANRFFFKKSKLFEQLQGE